MFSTNDAGIASKEMNLDLCVIQILTQTADLNVKCQIIKLWEENRKSLWVWVKQRVDTNIMIHIGKNDKLHFLKIKLFLYKRHFKRKRKATDGG